MEEGLIQQIHNPSHTDPSRFGFLAGALSGFVTLVTLSAVFPALPRLIAAYLSLGVVAAVGTLVTVRITAKRKERRVQDMIEEREMQQAEAARKIAGMKALNRV